MLLASFAWFTQIPQVVFYVLGCAAFIKYLSNR